MFEIFNEKRTHVKERESKRVREIYSDRQKERVRKEKARKLEFQGDKEGKTLKE